MKNFMISKIFLINRKIDQVELQERNEFSARRMSVC